MVLSVIVRDYAVMGENSIKNSQKTQCLWGLFVHFNAIRFKSVKSYIICYFSGNNYFYLQDK